MILLKLWRTEVDRPADPDETEDTATPGIGSH